MAIKRLKQASEVPTSANMHTQSVVEEILRAVESGKENAAVGYARELDKYSGPIRLTGDTLETVGRQLSSRIKEDIEFAHKRIRDFAVRQQNSIQEFEVELSPGLFAGQRLIPINTAGCYVPGGRYAHIASALMSVTTARVAGVDQVVVCTPPRGEAGIHPAVAYAIHLAGADHILALGGVQGIAAMAFGLFTQAKADMIVGPGNRFVTEAKRQLFGRVGIDLLAGPTEIAIIADETADPHVVAVDLVSQAEHGSDSPAWLIATSSSLADEVIRAVPYFIARLPEPAREAATASWRDYGEVLLCDTPEEAVELSDQYASEHLQVHTADPQWWLQRLRNYGSLFMGEETTVSFGDKCSGTNHILPTRGAARYTGGLSVHKFVKVVTYQRQTRNATRDVAKVAARLSRYEGMEAHARSGDVRLRKYFPEEALETEVGSQ